MRPDRYTKLVLTLIAIFLAVLALGHLGTPTAAIAQPVVAGDAYRDVTLVPYGNVGFIMFDRRTGGVWVYQQKSEKGFPFELMGPGGRIEYPGAGVKPLP